MAASVGALEEAQRELVASRLPEAMEQLLEAWRVTRAPALAELVEAVSAALQPRLPQLERGKRDAMQKEWLAVEKRRNPEDVPRLVKALSETHFRSTDAMARAKKMERWPADPRVAALLVDQLLHPQFTASSSKPFWQVVFGLFRTHADPRAVELLRGYSKRLPQVLGPDPYGDPKAAMRSWMRGRTEETIAWLEERFRVPPALESEAATLVARCRSLLGRESDVTSDLFAPIFAAPDAEDARAVCADALQERGDPRGELISLQLARAQGRASPESVAREQALLKRHLAQWLGPLRDVLEARFCMFDRGFLSQAFLRHDAQSLEQCVDSPWWSTVTSFHSPWSPRVASVVTAPVMRALRHLETDQSVFQAPPLAVTSLSVPGPDFEYRSTSSGYVSILDAGELDVMARAKTFPRLRHLALRGVHRERDGGYFAFLRKLPWFEQVEALTANADSFSSPPFAEWLEALEPFGQLRGFAVERSSNEYVICLTRAAGSTWTADVWTTKSWFATLVPAIEAVLRRIARVTVRVAPGPGPVHEKAVAALRARSKRAEIVLDTAPLGLTPLHRPRSIGDLWVSPAAPRWLSGRAV